MPTTVRRPWSAGTLNVIATRFAGKNTAHIPVLHRAREFVVNFCNCGFLQGLRADLRSSPSPFISVLHPHRTFAMDHLVLSWISESQER